MNESLPNPQTRSQRTREALILAGLRLFAAHPVDAVAIDEIVAEAGVSKGSFFNHFADKQAFAGEVATHVRLAIEARIAAANSGVTDPLLRLAGGMMVATAFAMAEPDQARVMLRAMASTTARDHPLNAGLRADLAACREAGLLRPEAEGAGLLFWLGSCQMIMLNVVERGLPAQGVAERMADLMVLSLAGLGIPEVRSREIAADCAARILGP